MSNSRIFEFSQPLNTQDLNQFNVPNYHISSNPSFNESSYIDGRCLRKQSYNTISSIAHQMAEIRSLLSDHSDKTDPKIQDFQYQQYGLYEPESIQLLTLDKCQNFEFSETQNNELQLNKSNYFNEDGKDDSFFENYDDQKKRKSSNLRKYSLESIDSFTKYMSQKITSQDFSNEIVKSPLKPIAKSQQINNVLTNNQQKGEFYQKNQDHEVHQVEELVESKFDYLVKQKETKYLRRPSLSSVYSSLPQSTLKRKPSEKSYSIYNNNTQKKIISN